MEPAKELYPNPAGVRALASLPSEGTGSSKFTSKESTCTLVWVLGLSVGFRLSQGVDFNGPQQSVIIRALY